MSARSYDFSVLISYQDEPDSVELVFIILNFVACVPVLMSVGAFRYFQWLPAMPHN